ncbi:MAG: MFS transporter, partial [Pseudomonas alloputida]
VIPTQDFGKTVGVVTLLNNLSQPLAGLLVGILAAPVGAQGVILLLAVLTTVIGAGVVWWFGGVRRLPGGAVIQGRAD